MKTWIAFFRGINVGGNHMLPMKALTALLEKLGYENVRTYIQSGNVVFRSKQTAQSIEQEIAKAVTKSHRFTPRILIMDRNALLKAIKNNPFPEAAANHKSLHLWFLTGPCSKPNVEQLEALKSANETYLLTPSVFYFHAPDGIGKSRLAGRVEKALGVEATARNWQTVTKVSELAQSLDESLRL